MRRRSASLLRKLERARGVRMTPAQWERQRRSFAWGNANLSDPSVTREQVERVADRMRADRED